MTRRPTTQQAPEVVKIQVREQALPAQEPETRGPAPIGTLVVAAGVVRSIPWLATLLLGSREGRA